MYQTEISTKRRLTRGILAALTATVLLTSGCGSSAKSPSRESLVTKLSNESAFSTLKTDTTKFTTFVGCIADFLIKKGKASDLSAYVAGKRKLDDVRGFASKSSATQAAKDCVTQSGLGS